MNCLINDYLCGVNHPAANINENIIVNERSMNEAVTIDIIDNWSNDFIEHSNGFAR